jgi:hypothetical protein
VLNAGAHATLVEHVKPRLRHAEPQERGKASPQHASRVGIHTTIIAGTPPT